MTMSDLNPGEYDSDDLDRLVAEADRKAAKLRHVEDVLDDEDDGFRFDPVTGESRLYKEV